MDADPSPLAATAVSALAAGRSTLVLGLSNASRSGPAGAVPEALLSARGVAGAALSALLASASSSHELALAAFAVAHTHDEPIFDLLAPLALDGHESATSRASAAADAPPRFTVDPVLGVSVAGLALAPLPDATAAGEALALVEAQVELLAAARPHLLPLSIVVEIRRLKVDSKRETGAFAKITLVAAAPYDGTFLVREPSSLLDGSLLSLSLKYARVRESLLCAKSRAALPNVISALVSHVSGAASGLVPSVPYADSVVTALLEPALSGADELHVIGWLDGSQRAFGAAAMLVQLLEKLAHALSIVNVPRESWSKPRGLTVEAFEAALLAASPMVEAASFGTSRLGLTSQAAVSLLARARLEEQSIAARVAWFQAGVQRHARKSSGSGARASGPAPRRGMSPVPVAGERLAALGVQLAPPWSYPSSETGEVRMFAITPSGAPKSSVAYVLREGNTCVGAVPTPRGSGAAATVRGVLILTDHAEFVVSTPKSAPALAVVAINGRRIEAPSVVSPGDVVLLGASMAWWYAPLPSEETAGANVVPPSWASILLQYTAASLFLDNEGLGSSVGGPPNALPQSVRGELARALQSVMAVDAASKMASMLNSTTTYELVRTPALRAALASLATMATGGQDGGAGLEVQDPLFRLCFATRNGGDKDGSNAGDASKSEQAMIGPTDFALHLDALTELFALVAHSGKLGAVAAGAPVRVPPGHAASVLDPLLPLPHDVRIGKASVSLASMGKLKAMRAQAELTGEPGASGVVTVAGYAVPDVAAIANKGAGSSSTLYDDKLRVFVLQVESAESVPTTLSSGLYAIFDFAGGLGATPRVVHSVSQSLRFGHAHVFSCRESSRLFQALATTSVTVAVYGHGSVVASQNAGLKVQLEEVASELAVASAELARLQADNAELQAQVKELQAVPEGDLDALVAMSVKDHAAAVQQAQTELEEVEAERAAVAAELDAALSENATLKPRAEMMEESLAQMTPQIEALRMQNVELQRKIESSASERELLAQVKIRRLQAENASLTDELAALHESNMHMDEVRALIAQSRQKSRACVIS
ncbi:uncharacterized protein AMSG_02996 [Thecamonas trahens ATCC 50062]|uniref:Uncharacterized protein n=1 Tax=Thecamonas trahens ATCC 50062 TaxID=461836 RepID=A0A0L0D332_THETB|nr:hypothetical protein AMSG_02996 [Thecamonas trahens ATCC 50062]KNC46560.1 hypothetical protein AMSG_02996 [Thecamonas trahens ATCC 50062]|eukprot:XP_013760339.1 hypothetical protein AMSG_02996 [Thecamonas trahens ATCC 50062]